MPRAATLLLALLIALPALLLPVPQEAAAKTRLSRDVTRITLRIPIQILGDASDLAPRPVPDGGGEEVEPADWFEEEAEAFWNPALARHAYNDCYTFVLDAGFKPITSEAEIKPGNQLLRFDPERSPDEPFLFGEGDPYEQDLEAAWGWAPIGPQLGYFLGLSEAVEEIDAGTVARLGEQAEKQLGPLPACVDAQDDDDDAAGDGPYTIYARYEWEWHDENEFAASTTRWAIEVWAAPDEAGNLTGEATFADVTTGWVAVPGDAPCSQYAYWGEGQVSGITVSGRHDRGLERNYVDLEVAPFEWQYRQYSVGCDIDFDGILPNPGLSLSGELADGRFEETAHPDDATTTHTLILERGHDDQEPD